jgi:hypothetical protein
MGTILIKLVFITSYEIFLYYKTIILIDHPWASVAQ